MKTIYVNKANYRDYSTNPEGLVWDVIPVDVADDFSGGGKRYDPETGEWVADAPYEMTAADYLAAAEGEKSFRLGEITGLIAPLQDAVDLDEATDEETALLKQWKQYRVALNRLDLSTAPDITWPDKPQ